MTASPRKQLGVLLVGYDGAGIQNHQLDMYEPAFAAHPRFDIVGVTDDAAVTDHARYRSRDAAARLGVAYLDSLDDALVRPDVDVLSVCVSFDRRLPTVERAAAHHKHMLIDKPMALTLAEVDRITEVTLASEVVCMPAHHHRFKESIRRAAQLVERGRLGSLLAVHADFLVARGATKATAHDPTVWPLGELMNFTVYPVDTIRHMCRTEVTSVFATRGGFFYGGSDDEDFGVLSLALGDGVIATLSVGRAPLTGHLSGGEHRYRLVGSEGMLVIDAQESTGTLHGRDRARRVTAPGVTNSITAMLDELARAIDSRAFVSLGPQDARPALAVTLAARRSAETGTVVDL